MLGLVITLVAATAPALPAAASMATCGDGPDSCELGSAVIATPEALVDEPPAVAPPAFATPAVIDCRSPVVPAVLSTLVGECIGTPQIHDASYRVSRLPESEDSQSLTPAGHVRRGAGTACDGLPQDAPRLTLSHVQPLALYARPVFVSVAKATAAPMERFVFASRSTDPPDRPPRV
ncbi:MAG TPA: hypothetical protein VHK47_09900 [Polyangia bacterium]|jgi:hypothetical protein|nr:hypothetical protein [Polyangia bacterium]